MQCKYRGRTAVEQLDLGPSQLWWLFLLMAALHKYAYF